MNGRAAWNAWLCSAPRDICPDHEAWQLLAGVADVDRPRAVDCLLKLGASIAWAYAEQAGGEVDLETLIRTCTRQRLGLAILNVERQLSSKVQGVRSAFNPLSCFIAKIPHVPVADYCIGWNRCSTGPLHGNSEATRQPSI
jgi:hypothetical protein